MLVELVPIEIEIKIHNIQIIATDFNGLTNFCFRNVCNSLFVFFEFFCIFSPFLWLSLTSDKCYSFYYDFLQSLSRFFLLKAYYF